MSDEQKHVILIVEDNPMDKKVIESYLSEIDAKLIFSGTGEDGLIRLKKETPIMILLDLSLPDYEGLELVKKMKKIANPLTSFIIVSGNEDQNILKGCYDEGAQLFLKKPVEKVQLKGIVKNVLDRNAFTISKLEDEQKKLQQKVLELEMMENALIESEAFSRSMLNSGSFGIVACDMDGKIQTFNSKAEDIFSFRANEILLMNVDILFPSLLAKSPIELIKQLAQNTKSLKKQKKMHGQKNGGHIFPIHITVDEIQNSNNTYFVLIIDDLTEAEMIEKQKKEAELKIMTTSKLAAIGELATGVAHELNQPLTYIYGLTQTLQMDILDNAFDSEETLSQLEIAIKEINRMTDIINHLRVFGRNDHTSKSPILLNNVYSDTMLLMGKKIKHSNVQITFSSMDSIPPVMGNSTQMEQVFINLIQNAIDALSKTENSKIDINIFLKDEKLFLSFQDNGPGIPKHMQEKIFEPFFTTKDVGKGTGLGLSIIYGIIKDFGGEITLNSSVQSGTEFLIEFPLIHSEGNNSNI